MGRLVYLMNVSLDGFVETPDHALRLDDRERGDPSLVRGPRP